MTKPKIISIVGPNASGKTEWGIKLAQKFKGEIISADSRQIYEGMDIGTGTPRSAWGRVQEENGIKIKGVPHHLINILEPDEKFSAANFKKKAFKKIEKIHDEGKIPFLVGGTGLYIQSVVSNYQFPNQGETKKRKELKEKPLKELRKQLKEIDPKSAKGIDLENKKRVIRALEVTQSSNKPISEQKKKGPRLFSSLQIGIKLPREKLYQKIDKRVEKMIKAGLKKEVKELIKTYGWNHILKNTIGYKEWQEYFEDRSSKEKVIKKIKKNSRNFAKRQLTWFQNKGKVNWIETLNEAKRLVNNFLNQ